MAGPRPLQKEPLRDVLTSCPQSTMRQEVAVWIVHNRCNGRGSSWSVSLAGGADQERFMVKDQRKTCIFLCQSFPPLEQSCRGPRLLVSCARLDRPAASGLGLLLGHSNQLSGQTQCGLDLVICKQEQTGLVQFCLLKIFR